MSKALQAQLVKTLGEQGDQARDMAVAELKDLKKDLAELEKALAAKKTPDQGLLMDICHGAFELFRTASIVLETDTLQGQLHGALEVGRDLEYLEKKGAMLLTKPEGWHWFTPKGEMIFLAAPSETRVAVQKLQERLTRKAPAKSTPSKPASPAPIPTEK
ncbi:MAG: hypothetical protein EOL86_00325 [Deltaproteobacteria bacterium]|nr:hypothetical protein [Deltaproteobacteria bacterium]